MKRFNDYTDAELIGIDNQTLNDSIRIESTFRGIQPPIPISVALRQSEWVGFTLPGDYTTVYAIRIGYSRSPFAYIKREDAEKALVGVVELKSSGYGANQKYTIQYEQPTVEEINIVLSESQQKAAKFVDFAQDDTEFNKVVEECMERVSRVRQDDYDRNVLAQRKAEYLRLAGGNLDIAKAFWSNSGNGKWPE